MSYGVLCRDLETKEVIYDSRKENTLFWVAEEGIQGANVGTGAGITFRYPAFAGKKLVVNLTSPYNYGELEGWAVLSCRISYPGGIPTVQVFVDNALAGIPVADGFMLVYYTGASQ